MADQPNGPIQIHPRGLLGFFNLKNVGRFPTELLETYQPTLPGLELLAHTNDLESAPFAGAGLITSDGILDVFGAASEREWRYYTHVHAYAETGVGGQLTCALGLHSPPLSGGIGRTIYRISDYDTAAASSNVSLMASKVWAWPGSRFCLLVKSLTAGPFDLALYRRYALFSA